MELIDRYVHAVGKRINKKQREDIEKELRSLILDELEAKTKGREPTEEDIVAVLKAMGHPARVAVKYNSQEHGLIGPGLLDTYYLVLKIVTAAVAFGVTVGVIVNICQAPMNAGALILQWIGQVISGAIGAVGGVTIVFAILERVVPEFSIYNPKGPDWNPKDLPPVPSKADEIKLGDPIASMVFTVIAIVLFNFFLDKLGVYYSDGGPLNFIPIFNMAAIALFLPFWNAVWVLDFIRNVILVAQGRERLGTRIYSLVMPVLSIIIAGMMLGGPSIISDGIVSSAASAASIEKLKDIFYIIYRVVLILAIIGSVVEFVKRLVSLIKSLA
jgi:hypothetical protein